MASESHIDLELREIGQLSRADFESAVGSEFEVDLNFLGITEDGTPLQRSDVYPDGQILFLKVVELTPRKALSADLRPDPFTLLFCGSIDTPLYNDVHVLRHASLGRIAVFLTPVNVSPGILAEQHPEGRFYEAVMN